MSDKHVHEKMAALEVGLGATAELLKRGGSPAAKFIPHHGHAAKTGAQLVGGAAAVAPAAVAVAAAAAPVVVAAAVAVGIGYGVVKFIEWLDD